MYPFEAWALRPSLMTIFVPLLAPFCSYMLSMIISICFGVSLSRSSGMSGSHRRISSSVYIFFAACLAAAPLSSGLSTPAMPGQC